MAPWPRSLRGYRIGSDPRNSLYTPRPYVYRGTKFTTDEDEAKAAQRTEQGRRAALSQWKPGNPIDHGTERGYEREQRQKLPHCQPCKDAHTAYTTASRRRRKAAA